MCSVVEEVLDRPQNLFSIFLDFSSIFLNIPRSLHVPSIFPNLSSNFEIRTMGFAGGDHCVRRMSKSGSFETTTENKERTPRLEQLRAPPIAIADR